MKVVFDTNILVSALVFPGGRADFALRRIIEGADQLLLSKPILDELLGILARNFSATRKNWHTSPFFFPTCPSA